MDQSSGAIFSMLGFEIIVKAIIVELLDVLKIFLRVFFEDQILTDIFSD
jgi:hypothetical protein